MHSQKIKSKLYINIFIGIIIFALIYFVLYPQYTGTGTFYSPKENISKLLKEKKDYDKALIIAAEYNSKLSKANVDYKNALNTLDNDTLTKILPGEADPLVVIYELTKIASRPESGMLLSDPKFSDDSNNNLNKKYNTIKVGFSLKGSYNQIKGFLRNLEKSERIYNISSLNFSSSQDDKSGSIFEYTVEVETYYLKKN